MFNLFCRAALCGLMIFLPVTSLDAGCGHFACHQAVVAQVVQPVFVAQFVELPVYSVTLSGYGNSQPPPAAPAPVQPSACEQKLADLTARFDSLSRDFETLRGLNAPAPKAVQPKATEPKTDPLQTSAQKCFQCHSETAAAKDGAKFVLFKGTALLSPNDLPPAKVVKVLTMVSETREGHAQMPPAKNGKGVASTTDAESAAWHDWAATLTVAK